MLKKGQFAGYVGTCTNDVDRIRNDVIIYKAGVIHVEDKIREARPTFRHIKGPNTSF